MKELLCGLGAMGRNHLRVLERHPDITSIDIYDPYADIPKEQCVDDLDDYLASPDKPDFAIIATPTVTHRELARILIDQDIPLLIEKPLARSQEEAQEILEWAQEKNLPCAVGFVERFNPVVNALKKELRNNHILSISINRVGPFPPRIKDVGVLVDLSVHDIDLVRFLLGGAEILESRVFKSQKNNPEFEDNAVIAMRMAGEIVVNLTTNWLTPFKKRTIEVATENAYYEANLLTQELKAYSHYEQNNSHVVKNCFVKRVEPLYMELDSFLNFLKSGDPGHLASFTDGVEALKVLEKRRAYHGV